MLIEVMIVLTTAISMVGLGIIIEQATGAFVFLKAWLRTRPRPWASPHARGDDEGDSV